jgi:hypothetical protein
MFWYKIIGKRSSHRKKEKFFIEFISKVFQKIVSKGTTQNVFWHSYFSTFEILEN